jgi:hypothetical protein
VPEISKEQVDAAEAVFLDAKVNAEEDPEGYRQAAQAFADLRVAWKQQEEAAGNRSGFHAPVVSNYEE